jgi:hypothetical protein
MADSSFDAAHAVRFDLSNGSVRAAGDARVALIPVEALAAIGKSNAADDVAKTIGAAIGKRAATKLGQGATVEAFANALGGELAVAGYGTLTVERWGKALVIAVGHSAVPDAMLATLVGAAVEAVSGRAASCVVVSHSGGSTRLLVASESGAAKVRAWMSDGVHWGDALTRLNGGAA